MKQTWILFTVLIISITLMSCDEDPYYFEDDFSTVPAPYDTTSAERIIKDNGLKIYIHSEGVGEFVITERDRVLLFYTFRLKDGTIVQSTYANGNQISNEFSMTSVVRGFREGLLGAKNGSRRTLVIPPHLGYGDSPTNQYRADTLYYDIFIDQILE